MSRVKYLLIVLLLITGTALAQVSITNYSFSATSGTFTELTGATSPALSGGSLDDGWYNNIPIGFDFWYMGQKYTTVSATTNGWLTFDQALSSAGFTNNLTSGTPRPVIAPLWDDLDQETFGTFSYKTEGTAPNRVFTAEWKNYAWNFSATSPVISFQVKLYEGTGVIEFVYRDEPASPTSPSASIGITAVGTGSGNFLSLDGTGTNPNVSSTVETTTLSTEPATGQTYTFTPPTTTPSQPTTISFSAITTNSMRFDWENVTNEAGYSIWRSTDGTNFSFETFKNTDDTFYVATGLAMGTKYHWRIYAVNEGRASLPLQDSCSTNWGTVFGNKWIILGYTATDTYPSFTAAINDLNTNLVGPGGVTFNVDGGQTFTEILPPITATGTSTAPIVFQKTPGTDADVWVQRTDAGTIATSTLGGQGDAVITIDGGDYITFDQINVTATDQGIEYGYYLRKASATDGCKNVTIKNCKVYMTKGTSQYVVGIYSSNNDATSPPNSATGITITSDGGRADNVQILGNDIRNVFSGILLRGHSTYANRNTVVGGLGSGNFITNYAGNTAQTAYGVYIIYEEMPTVAYNWINNTANGGAPFTSIGYGIMNSTTTNGGGTIIYNEIQLSSTTGQLSGIYCTVGGTNPLVVDHNTIDLSITGGSSAVYYIYVTGTYPQINISNNIFMSFGGIAATGACYLIYNSNATNNISVYNNQVVGGINRTAASGNFYGYYNFGSPTGGIEYLQYNNFSNITLAGSAAFYGIYSNTSTNANRVAMGNVISNITGGTGAMYCLYLLSTTNNYIYENQVSNITGGGTIYGIYFTGTNPYVYKNKVYGLQSTGSSPYVDGIYMSSGTTANIYNNFVYDLRAPSSAATNGVVGIYISGGTTANVYYNSIFLNATSTGTNFGTSGIYASTTPTVDLRNNIVVNNSQANGTGYTVAYRRSSTTLSTYASTSDCNDFYSNPSFGTGYIFYDGTNLKQTLAEYKAWVSPRDANTISDDPHFLSTSDVINLHLDPNYLTCNRK
ncbi:MAG: fibronectin type III domain-containing protein, partial [candidate division WOR-3 bacterium]